MVVALKQYDVCSGFGGGIRSRAPRRTTTDDQHVAAMIDGDVARGFADVPRAVAGRLRAAARFEEVRRQKTIVGPFDSPNRRFHQLGHAVPELVDTLIAVST